MRNVMAIAKREFSAYFNSPIAYIVAVVYITTGGYLFFRQLFIEGQADMRPFFGLAPLLFLFIMPLLTMRLIAEEKREGTLELLLSMPVTDWQVVLGKYLASIGLIAVLLALTVTFPITVASLGPLDKGATFAAYIGMLLMCGAYAAIGLMASAFTRNQIVAVLIAFFISFALFLVGQLVQILPPGMAPIANAVSITTRFQNIARGVLDTRDLLYYASMIFGCLLIAEATLESRRWR
jgi:gliding motility-associated transport system permease protein